jgi:Icc-related predicted phosphoesterase
MRIAACADVHSPIFLENFSRSLESLGKVDLFLLAGDLVSKSRVEQLSPVLACIRRVCAGPVLSCFGNEEYEQDRERYREYREVRWLEEEAELVQTGEGEVGVVGSKGSLDRPTFWQRKNLPGIWQVYRERVEKIDSLLAGLRTKMKIVLTHYAPTYRTLEGEKESSWPEMACRGLEEVIKRRQPDLWIHGHAHNGKVTQVEMGRTLVVNASLPARGSVVVLELPRRVGLERFLP